MRTFRIITFWLIIIWALAGSGLAYYFYNRCPEEVVQPTEVELPISTEPVSVEPVPEISDTLAPEPVSLPKRAVKAAKSIFSNPNIYKVKKSDKNLYRIGLDVGVHYDTLKKWNNLPDYTIYPGQKLFIGTEERREELKREEALRIAADTTACDSIRSYQQDFKEDGVEGTMYARVRGVMLDGFVDITSKPTIDARPKNHLWLTGGVGLDQPNLSVGGMYTVKGKWGVGYEWSPSKQTHTHEIKGALNIF